MDKRISKTYGCNCTGSASGGTGLLSDLRFWTACAVWGYIYGRTEK